jgi:Uri superfamily endonuclease
VSSESGTYALVLRSSCSAQIPVGRAGVLDVRCGDYVYVGSAFGPGGVRARVARHLAHGGRLHWHIDYLRRTLGVREIWYSHDPIPREHEWARILCQAMGRPASLPRFGASDCGCDSHLAFFARLPSFRAFRAHVQAAILHHHEVKRVPGGG